MWHASGMSKARVTVHEHLSAEEARRAMLALVAMGLDAQAHRERDLHHGLLHGERHEHRPVPAEAGQDDGTSVTAGGVTARGATAGRATALAATAALPGAMMAAAAGAMRASSSTWQVCVAEDEVDAALPILAEDLGAAETAPPVTPVPRVLGDARGEIWTLRHASASLAIAFVGIAVHLFVHQGAGPSPRSTMIEAGVVAPWLVKDGQWWRLLTAAFLHFDIKHLVGNTSSLLFLGPPLGASIGQLRLVVLFVVTALAGNLLSLVLGNEVAIKAGASGGICGILGALAGVAISAMAAATDARQRRPAWQTLGALVALFGMIVGFEPGHDHYAHVGGLVAGVVMGHMFGSARRSIA